MRPGGRGVGWSRVSPVVDDDHVGGCVERELGVQSCGEVGAFLAQCAEGGGVGAGLGGEVAAEPEHVRPLRSRRLEFGDPPSSQQVSISCRAWSVRSPLVKVDRSAGAGAVAAGQLRVVVAGGAAWRIPPVPAQARQAMGNSKPADSADLVAYFAMYRATRTSVRSRRGRGQPRDRTYVESARPSRASPCRAPAIPGPRNRGAGDTLSDRCFERSSDAHGGRGRGWAVWSVESDDGVEVHDAACLVLGDLANWTAA